ncbi:MAG: NADH-quinone oxidoreductase subunit M, partial [Gammaproteobacteria bacterium]|nr:NADH-quinone oxidoreductase subunit M [Gammaproteobacteria bacterium]
VVKLPGVPFHTWLTDAHTQAPTAGSVLLAGILLKTGAYGLLRFVVPLFPEAALDFRWPAMFLGAVSVVYGGYLAYSQSDFKRLVAYSSISHMGFVLLGVFAWNTVALQGAVVQMVAHGFSTAALFMMAGALQQRLHTREMGEMGGLWVRAPRMGAVTMFFVIASLGMPGLGNFVGEFMVLLGAFQVNMPLTIAAAVGIVVAAVYALFLMQRSFEGTPNPDVAEMADFGAREMSVMILMMVALLWLGVYPETLLGLSRPVLLAMNRNLPEGMELLP